VKDSKNVYGVAVVEATIRCVAGLLPTPCVIIETRGVWLLTVHSIKFLLEVSKKHAGYIVAVHRPFSHNNAGMSPVVCSHWI
jgi:hypothetical protein